jgi:hypothetical protein
VGVAPLPKFQAYVDPVIVDVEVLIRRILSPKHILIVSFVADGIEVKLAIGVCAHTEKCKQKNKMNNPILYLTSFNIIVNTYYS